MATQSTRSNVITFTGDVTGTQTINAAANVASPGSIQILALASGANTITVPVATGITVTGVTIVPPAGNTVAITLKGVTGDTGILLHETDPSTLAIDNTVTSFVLTAGAAVEGVRLFWT
jgi:hypothetical protein